MLQGGFVPYFPSPDLLNQFCNFHLGIVRNLKDPDCRGRVQVECPGLLHTGKKNWTEWVEVGGTAIGGTKGKGDEGDWWPMQVGQVVLVGFISGDPHALWAIPGPSVQDGKGSNKQLGPLEAKKAGEQDPRRGTRCRIRKSEAGHTLIMDDNGKDELCALMNWTGSGIAWFGPGKKEDDSETEDEESKPRKGERRETKNVFADTAKKPSELCEGGKEYMGILDLLKQGILTCASDADGGIVTIGARKADGSLGPSLVLDGRNDAAFLQAGNTQIQLFGDSPGPVKERIFSTKQMILQTRYMDVKDYFSSILDKLKERFKKYDSSGSGGDGGGSAGAGGSSSSGGSGSTGGGSGTGTGGPAPGGSGGVIN